MARLRSHFAINEPTRFERVLIDSNAGGDTVTRLFRKSLGMDGVSIKAVRVAAVTSEPEPDRVPRRDLLMKLRQKREAKDFEVIDSLPLASELLMQMEHAGPSDNWREQDADDDLLSSVALALWIADKQASGFIGHQQMNEVGFWLATGGPGRLF